MAKPLLNRMDKGQREKFATYPEHEKLLTAKAAPLGDTLSSFLDYLSHEGFVLAKWHQHSDLCFDEERDQDCEIEKDTLMQTYVHPSKLIAGFLEIDEEKLETEKRAMLEMLRKEK